LGLAIARWVARAHGGDIEARNRASGGASFEIVLPRADP
jgi:two-component system OmpR family sensor kinase